jgi:hypothetical protein
VIKDKVPEFLKRSVEIIGLENFNDYKKFRLSLKYATYFAYLILSVMIRNILKNITKNIEDTSNEEMNRNTLKSTNTETDFFQKHKYILTSLDFFAKYMMIALTICI